MAKGHPDWRPTSPAAALTIVEVEDFVAPFSGTLVPAVAGQRPLLFGLSLVNAGGAALDCTFEERTSGGVLVRNVGRLVAQAGNSVSFNYEGAAIGVGNRVDYVSGAAVIVTLTYAYAVA